MRDQSADIAAPKAQKTVAPKAAEYSGAKRPDPDGLVHIISFFLAEAEYAFDLKEAVEVLKPRPLTEVPRVPQYIKGVLSVRGEMIAVIDLGMRIGIPKASGGRILVASIEGEKTGFVVERFSGVSEVPLKSIEPVGYGFVKGIIRLEDKTITLLDAIRLIEPEIKAT